MPVAKCLLFYNITREGSHFFISTRRMQKSPTLEPFPKLFMTQFPLSWGLVTGREWVLFEAWQHYPQEASHFFKMYQILINFMDFSAENCFMMIIMIDRKCTFFQTVVCFSRLTGHFPNHLQAEFQTFPDFRIRGGILNERCEGMRLLKKTVNLN